MICFPSIVVIFFYLYMWKIFLELKLIHFKRTRCWLLWWRLCNLLCLYWHWFIIRHVNANTNHHQHSTKWNVVFINIHFKCRFCLMWDFLLLLWLFLLRRSFLLCLHPFPSRFSTLFSSCYSFWVLYFFWFWILIIGLIFLILLTQILIFHRFYYPQYFYFY